MDYPSKVAIIICAALAIYAVSDMKWLEEVCKNIK